MEAIFLDCGVGGPQLKRNPLGSHRLTMVTPRLTEAAFTLLKMADAEAAHRGHPFVGTEHILLAMTGEADCGAAMVIRRLGIDPLVLRKAYDTNVKVGLHGEPSSDFRRPYTVRTKHVLTIAEQEALELGHPAIGTEHLLLAILKEGGGVAASLLVDVGVFLPEARQAAVHLIFERQSVPF